MYEDGHRENSTLEDQGRVTAARGKSVCWVVEKMGLQKETGPAKAPLPRRKEEPETLKGLTHDRPHSQISIPEMLCNKLNVSSFYPRHL
jgi:hypothetical protein